VHAAATVAAQLTRRCITPTCIMSSGRSVALEHIDSQQTSYHWEKIGYNVSCSHLPYATLRHIPRLVKILVIIITVQRVKTLLYVRPSDCTLPSQTISINLHAFKLIIDSYRQIHRCTEISILETIRNLLLVKVQTANIQPSQYITSNWQILIHICVTALT